MSTGTQWFNDMTNASALFLFFFLVICTQYYHSESDEDDPFNIETILCLEY